MSNERTNRKQILDGLHEARQYAQHERSLAAATHSMFLCLSEAPLPSTLPLVMQRAVKEKRRKLTGQRLLGRQATSDGYGDARRLLLRAHSAMARHGTNEKAFRQFATNYLTEQDCEFVIATLATQKRVAKIKFWSLVHAAIWLRLARNNDWAISSPLVRLTTGADAVRKWLEPQYAWYRKKRIFDER